MTALNQMCFTLILYLMILTVSGCMIIPVPRYDTAPSRCNISEQETRRFEPGATTRRDLILALGEPDAVSIDERKLVYCWQRVVAWWIIVGFEGTAGAGDAGEIYDADFFVAEFDARGVLVRFAESKRFPELVPTLSSYGDHRILLQNSAKLYAGVDGFKGIWYRVNNGIPGQLLLTEHAVIFIEDALLSNAAPTREWAYPLIRKERLAKFGRSRRLVLYDHSGGVSSIEVLDPTIIGMMVDVESVQKAHAIIQTRINR